MKLSDKYNRKYMKISLYVIANVVIIYILTRIADNITVIANKFMEILGWVIKVIRPVIIGFVLAYLLDPVVSFFEIRFGKYKLFRRMKKKRTWATVLSVALLVAVIAGLISMLVYSVTNQLRLANFDDIMKLGQEYLDSLESFYTTVLNKLSDLDIESAELQQYVKDVSSRIVGLLKRFAESTIISIGNMSNYLTTVIFSFIIGFYFIIDGRMFMNYIRKISYALFSDRTNEKMINIIHDLDRVFSGYVRGQLTDALVMMVLISSLLSITRVKFAIVIGVFAGLGNLIPYFGPVIAYVSTAFVCLINGDMKTLAISIIALVIVQFIDGNFIGPKLLSRSIKIHPLIIIISLIFGSAIGGLLGMLLAVPTGAYLKLVFVRFINQRTKKKEELKKTAMRQEALPVEGTQREKQS